MSREELAKKLMEGIPDAVLEAFAKHAPLYFVMKLNEDFYPLAQRAFIRAQIIKKVEEGMEEGMAMININPDEIRELMWETLIYPPQILGNLTPCTPHFDLHGFLFQFIPIPNRIEISNPSQCISGSYLRDFGISLSAIRDQESWKEIGTLLVGQAKLDQSVQFSDSHAIQIRESWILPSLVLHGIEPFYEPKRS